MMRVLDINKSLWCIDGRHARCHGRRVCNCRCHLTTGDFVPSIRWAFTVNNPTTAHMQREHQAKERAGRIRAECGIWAFGADLVDGSLPVCIRCLKATQHRQIVLPSPRTRGSRMNGPASTPICICGPRCENRGHCRIPQHHREGCPVSREIGWPDSQFEDHRELLQEKRRTCCDTTISQFHTCDQPILDNGFMDDAGLWTCHRCRNTMQPSEFECGHCQTTRGESYQAYCLSLLVEQREFHLANGDEVHPQ